MSASPTSKRVAWVDVAKGVGISLIVLGHANRSIDRTSGLTWTNGLEALDTVLYSFHVPLFFVLAGVSVTLASPGWRNGMRGLLVGIFIPYLLWSAIWIVSKSVLPGGLVNQPLDLTNLWQILWAPVDHFWFLYHLIFIRVIWLLAEGTLDRFFQIALMFALALSGAAVRELGSDWAFVAHFLDNTALFGFGLLLVRPVMGGTSEHFKLALICLAVFASLLLIKGAVEMPVVSLVISITGLMAVLFAITFFEKKNIVDARSWLARLGQASLVIFLLHGFAIGTVRFGLSKLDLLTNETLLIFGTAAGIGLPFLAYVLVNEMSKQSGRPVMSWIGWGRSYQT